MSVFHYLKIYRRSIHFSFIFNTTDLFEGDIVMDQRLRSWVTGESDKRDAINDVSYLWPASDDGTVRVPYTLSDEIQRGKKSV